MILKKLELKKFIFLCLAFILAGGMLIRAEAAEQNAITIMKMVTVSERTEAKKEPSDSAEVLVVFEAGADILVVEEIDEEWYSIAYKAEIGYIKKAETEEKVSYAEELEVADKELEEVGYETTLLVEELEKEKTESKKSILWGVVIAVLVIAIFGVGIAQNVLKKKAGEGEEEKEDKTEKEEEGQEKES
ncbi:MAG: hypothetical protein IJP31_09100 [Lachnospiraceae bacterium]|nr:hypothetical protein [Lachnospiraceae bacterium]